MADAKPFLVLKAEDLSTLLPQLYQRSGNFDTMFARVAELGAHPVIAADLTDLAAALPGPEGFAGVFISGSAAMVTEQAPWMLRAQGWIRNAGQSGTPVLGICFGHQLIAAAMGGEVGPALRHTYESVEVTLTAAGRDDLLLSVLPKTSWLQSAHSQIATRLPLGVEPLALAAPGAYAARFAENLWGVQFHPEFDQGDMAIIINDVRGELQSDGLSAADNIARLRPTPDGPALMRRFRDIALAK